MTPTVRSFISSFNRLEEPVRQHLKNVYACLMFSTLAAGVGAYVHMYTELFSAGTFTVLAALGFLITLMVTPDNGKNRKLRLGYLLGFAFCSGLGIGPILEFALEIDPRIVMTSFVSTAIVFTSFSLCALLARSGYWLYLGSMLMTLCSTFLFLTLANVFLGSYLIFQAHIYIGLVMMCAFVLYDTQLIIEKRRSGDKDFVGHSVDLFIDFIGIFRRILIILTRRECCSNNSSNRREEVDD